MLLVVGGGGECLPWIPLNLIPNNHVPLALMVVILLVVVIQLVAVISSVCIIMEPQAFRHIYTNLLTSGLVFPHLYCLEDFVPLFLE